MTSNADRFTSIYNELDRFMRRNLGSDVGREVSFSNLVRQLLDRKRITLTQRDDLLEFARLRNAIVHNPDRDATPIAEPHDRIVGKFAAIVNQVINPAVALDEIAVKAKDIFITTPNSNALDVMKKMSKFTYTHVPVMEADKLIGVFSEETVFAFIVKNQDVIVDSSMLIKEFADFIPIENHQSEYYEFVSKKTLVADIEEAFQIGLKGKKRISVIFVTENGKLTETLLGLITAWDLVGYEK